MLECVRTLYFEKEYLVCRLPVMQHFGRIYRIYILILQAFCSALLLVAAELRWKHLVYSFYELCLNLGFQHLLCYAWYILKHGYCVNTQPQSFRKDMVTLETCRTYFKTYCMKYHCWLCPVHCQMFNNSALHLAQVYTYVLGDIQFTFWLKKTQLYKILE